MPVTHKRVRIQEKGSRGSICKKNIIESTVSDNSTTPLITSDKDNHCNID